MKLWNPETPTSLRTWKDNACVNQSIWSPHHPDVFASCTSTGELKIWDCRQPHQAQQIAAHNAEVLCLDWNKYRKDEIVTGSVDTTLKVWDVRQTRQQLTLTGHEYAVKRVKCSPHNGDLIGSVSYDMTMRLWNTSQPMNTKVHQDHSEFVMGIDFNLFKPVLATCSWDESIHVFPV